MIFDPGPTSFCRAAHSCSGGRSRSAGVEAALGSIRACEASSFAETVATSLHRPDVKFLFFDRKGGKQKRAPCCRSPNGKQKECEGRYALGPGTEKIRLLSTGSKSRWCILPDTRQDPCSTLNHPKMRQL